MEAERKDEPADVQGPTAALTANPAVQEGPAGAEQWLGTAASTGGGQELPAAWLARLPAWSQRVQPPRWLPDLPARRGGRPGPYVLLDVRRTVRCWARWGRPGLLLVRQGRPRRPGRLVVLWDVSGSMADTFELYLAWLYALVQQLPQAGVFPFGPDVVDATAALRRPYAQVFAELQQLARVWSGGTRMGAALHTWLVRYGPQWLGAQTTVVVLSDGWDTGPPQLVADALRTLRACDAAVWWIHPLLTTPGFAPKTRTLRAAQPYLLGLLPGDSPAALLALAGL